MRSFWKRFVVAPGVVAVLMAFPALSFAQGTPPDPPVAVIYGEANGAVEGQPVIALGHTDGAAVVCGSSHVKNDSQEGIVYAVDIESRDGCTGAGRELTLYFDPAEGTARYLASPTVTLASDDFHDIEHDVTLDTELGHQLMAPMVSHD